MSTYRLSAPYERPPLQRRASGLALALLANLALLFILLTLDKFAPEVRKASHALVIDLIPESHSSAARETSPAVEKPRSVSQTTSKPAVKAPPVILPAKPTIAIPPPQTSEKSAPWIEMSKGEMASGDISKLAQVSSGHEGDSEVVGTGPHGEVLYAAQWARHPTNAELGGYLPANAPDGFGLIACKTIPEDRVDDCVELDQEPHGSHLASAVRQAAWQFRIRPPRKNGVPTIGEWVQIRIDYERIDRTSGL